MSAVCGYTLLAILLFCGGFLALSQSNDVQITRYVMASQVNVTDYTMETKLVNKLPFYSSKLIFSSSIFLVSCFALLLSQNSSYDLYTMPPYPTLKAKYLFLCLL